MKQKIYVLIAIANIIIYFYLLFFSPKLETYSLEEYKNMMENISVMPVNEIEQLAKQENNSYLYIDNIEEFADKYKGEIPLVEITSILRKNINENFKVIAYESKQKDITKLFSDNKDILQNFMGIDKKEDVEKLLQKLIDLKDESVNITKAEVIKDSCKVEENDTQFNLILYLDNEKNIQLSIKVNNFLKNQRPALVVG